jgi:hypothetical protein
MPLFTWPDIVRMYHYLKKRSVARKVTKARLNQVPPRFDVLTQNRLLRISKSIDNSTTESDLLLIAE